GTRSSTTLSMTRNSSPASRLSRRGNNRPVTEEKGRLADLCQWGWARPRTDGNPASPVIVITGADLFDPDGMERRLGRMPDPGATAKTGPWSLLEFAAATQKGYLDLSDEELIEMRYGRQLDVRG
ncbi:hypothetical protein MR829_17625, partial [Paracoccus versutus]|uniref:hypothetical protein n=1 Tax=Paracoccus versutus TaxID=34007 RepID=UPI001FB80B32